jgi:TetR/AcrR family transcriptional regulator, regulator of autoinduction and epiphytic fitness
MDEDDEKRRRIVDAAVEEFQERGYRGASMDRISARAGVSKRTVYTRFPGKEALFVAILGLMVEQAAISQPPSFDPSRPVAPQLDALAWAKARVLLSRDFLRLARLVVGETIRDPALAAAMSERMEKTRPYRDFFAAADAAGALEVDDPGRAATEFLGVIKAHGFWPVLHTAEPLPEPEMRRAVEGAVALMLRRYTPSEPRRAEG